MNESSPERQELISLKETAKQIYIEVKSEPIWWPEEILDSLEVEATEKGFILKSPQAKNYILGISTYKKSDTGITTYFFEVTEPSEETVGLIEKSSGMAINQNKAAEIYKSLAVGK